MTLSKRNLRTAATMVHHAMALGTLLALMILIPTRDPGKALGSQFRDISRVPVKVQAMTPANLQLASVTVEANAPR